VLSGSRKSFVVPASAPGSIRRVPSFSIDVRSNSALQLDPAHETSRSHLAEAMVAANQYMRAFNAMLQRRVMSVANRVGGSSYPRK
jgi:hypothetical protein